MRIRVLVVVAMFLLPVPSIARADDLALPNLVASKPFGITVGPADAALPTGTSTPAFARNLSGPPSVLRFAVATTNAGAFPLDVEAGVPQGAPANPATTPLPALQCVRWLVEHVCAERRDAGTLVWHPAHNHFHYENYARYELRRLRDREPDMSDDGLVSQSRKVSFCLEDSEQSGEFRPMDLGWYNTCDGVVQGISPGWMDIYGEGLEGQQLDLVGVPSGDYAIVVIVNPDALLLETTTSDNTAFQNVHIDWTFCPPGTYFGVVNTPGGPCPIATIPTS